MLKTKIYKSTIPIFLFLITCIMFSCQSLEIFNEDQITQFEIGDSLYFSLRNINPQSISYNEEVGPQNFLGKVELIYFTSNETWNTCIDRFGHLYEIYNDNFDFVNSVENVMLIGVGKSNNIPISAVDGRKKMPHKKSLLPISKLLNFWK